MGQVYLAEDTRLGRRVAIKLLSSELIADERANKRLIKEARSAAQLDHPNICAIHEVGQEHGRSFIVMQYLDGETLEQKLKGHKLPLKQALDIAIETAQALAEAHSQSIIHRDIKPANIMITTRGQTKVMDFGLAKLVSPQQENLNEAKTETFLSTPGTVIGTLPYMSPEQVRGEPLDGRSDIFSFGVVLYEMLSGEHPFSQKSAAATAAAILTYDPPAVMQSAGEASSLLQNVVSKCLEKDREQRYRTINDLEKDLVRAKQVTGSSATVPLPAKDAEKASSSRKPLLRWRATTLIIAAVVILTTLVYFMLGHRVASGSRPIINSLAVLPLKPFDASDNSLGLGIADALIRKISQTGQVVVRPTSAVRRYLNDDTDALTAGRQLNADAVLEGSVQRDADRLRIVVNLMRTLDGFSLWSQQFDMHQSDVFTIQDSVAQQIASRLRLQLDPAQQSRFTKQYTSSTRAYDFYSQGIYNLEQRGFGISTKPQMEVTIDLFRKAITEDPNYALAHAQLAYAYAWTALFVEPQDPVWGEQAQKEIDDSQKLDSQLAETHLARYLILWSGYGGWQIEAAIRELQLAQQLNPNVGHIELGSLYQHVGLEDLAAVELQRAVEVDPTSELVKNTIVDMHNIVRDYDNELLTQQNFFGTNKPSVWYLLGKGRLEEAQEQIDKSGSSILYLPEAKGLLFALKKDFASADREIPLILSQFSVRDPDYHHATYDVACIYALEGKVDEAVKWLTETAATGFPNYPLFARDPYLNRIRQAPEFVQFLTRMKEQNVKYRQVAEAR